MRDSLFAVIKLIHASFSDIKKCNPSYIDTATQPSCLDRNLRKAEETDLKVFYAGIQYTSSLRPISG